MTRSWQLRLGIALICTITSIATARAQNPPATATKAVPRSVPFSGQLLTPKGEARAGAVMLTFGLYGDQKDSAPIWIEQHLVTLDGEGRYSVILGSTSAEGLPADAFAAGTPRWMGVQVEGETEQPRMMLLSVPYALKAGDADTIAGKPATEFVLSSNLSDSVKSAMKESKDATSPNDPAVTANALVKYANSGGAQTESSVVDVGGKVGIQVAVPGTELDIAGFGGSTTITLRNSGYAADAVKLASVDGSLRIGSATTANMINLIGTNIGLQTITPGFPLTFPNTLGDKISLYGQSGPHYGFGIQGSLLQIHSSSPAADIAFGTGTSAALTENVRFTGDGLVGIGVVPSSFNKLHIVAGPVSRGVFASTTSSGEAFHGVCVTSGVNCYAVQGEGNTGGFAGVFTGGKGVFSSSSDASFPGVDSNASGTNAYGVEAHSTNYRGAFTDGSSSFYSLYVQAGGVGTTGAYVGGDLDITGNFSASGSKAGYVVDAMQNVDSAALEPGDVVVITGNSAPVRGEIPVVTVRKAAAAYDTSVAGVVDQALYVPDAATKAAYGEQEAARRAAMDARRQAQRAAEAKGTKADLAAIAIPDATITDAQGNLHALQDVSVVGSGDYANVVTLGSYKMIKVDASFGAIHAGDLLTTSTNPGYAMKVSDKVAAIGAIVGKALGGLESGTGTIPVMVMPR